VVYGTILERQFSKPVIHCHSYCSSWKSVSESSVSSYFKRLKV